MTRFRAIALAALLVVATISMAVPATVQPAAATTGSSDVFTDAVSEQVGFWGQWSPGDDVVQYGAEGYPGWIVSYSDETALEEWVNASSERTIRQRGGDSQWMLVSAPADDVGSFGLSFGLLDQTLAKASYVEWIGLNRRVDVDPLQTSQLENETAWSKPAGADAATLWGHGSGSFTSQGIAFGGDIEQRTLGNATNATGADQLATSADGSGQTVGIVDDGLNYDSDLYGDRLVAGKNTVTNETIDPASNDYAALEDTTSPFHGSWVTTAIAGNGSQPRGQGVAPGADIVFAKALGDDGSGETVDVAEGIEYVASQGADVISLSLGSPTQSRLVDEEIEEALDEDDVSAVVVAAGNSRQTYRYLASPADNEQVIAVAATDARTLNASESAYFSNVGPDPRTGADIDIGAPGMKITASVAPEVNASLRSSTLSGTSMATPIVSGTAIVVLQQTDDLEGQPATLETRLEDTADRMPAAGETEVGAGRINVSDAVAGTDTDQSQSDARDSTAEDRDAGNRALGGSLWRSLVAPTEEAVE